MESQRKQCMCWMDASHVVVGVVVTSYPDGRTAHVGCPLPAKSRCPLALAFGLRPELATDTAQSLTAVGKLHLGIRDTIVSPPGTPSSPVTTHTHTQM